MLERKRGIALVLTLLVASLLLLLAGAFVTVNRTNVAMMGATDAHVKALEAAQAGVDYCRMRLEINNHWGNGDSADIDTRTVSVPGFTIYEKIIPDVIPPGKTHQVIGVLAGGDSHFQIVFRTVRTLAGSDISSAAVSDQAIEQNPTAGLSTWVQVDLRKEDISSNYLFAEPWEPTLQSPVTAPLPLLSTTQGRDVPGGSCKIISRGYCHGATRRIDASYGKNLITNSVAAAGGDMALIPNSGSKWYAGASINSKNQIQANSNTYLGNTTSGLGLDFFQFWGPASGNFGTVRAGSDVRQVDPNNLLLSYDNKDNLSVDPATTSSVLTPAQLSSAGTAANGTLLANVASTAPRTINSLDIENLNPTHRTVNADAGVYTIVDGSHVKLPDGSTVHQLDSAGCVTVDNGKLVVHGDTKLSFNGTANITSVPNSGVNPGIAIGYRNGYNLDSKASVVHVDGSLSVNGTVAGQGSLAAVGGGAGADDNGRMYIQGKSDLNSDPDVGVAIYANATVAINKPSGGSIKQADFSIFQAPVGAGSGMPAGSSQWSQSGNSFGNWGNLNPALKQARIGPVVSGSPVGDEGPVKANAGMTAYDSNDPSSIGPTDIRHADISNTLGLPNQNGTAANALLNDPSFHEINSSSGSGAAVISAYTKMLDVFNNTGTDVAINGTNNPVTVDSGSGGLSVGRYLRAREFLADNERWLEAGHSGATEISPTSLVWADLHNPDTNDAVNQMASQQYTFYASQLGVNTGSFTTLKDLYRQGTDSTITYNAINANFKGLIYSNKNIFVDLAGGSFQLQGAFISQANTIMRHLNNIVTLYDPTLLDKLTQAMNSGGGVDLNINYWSSN